MGISNQVLASITLWAGAAYLVQKKKPHWMLSLPAVFLTAVCVTYFLIAPYKVGGLFLGHTLSYTLGIAAAVSILVLFLVKKYRSDKKGQVE